MKCKIVSTKECDGCDICRKRNKCPNCGEEANYFYRDTFSDKIIGCDSCIEKELAND